ncbi:MAG: hypothetical protein AAGA54_16585 [Myxococcota bacterium]
MLLVLGVSAVAGFAGCFTAPSADVQFSCDPEDAPACPPGYACEADGCCHRDGTDVQATFGDCKLEGGSGGFPTTDTDPGGSGSTGADTDDAASSSSTAGTTGTTGTTSGSTGSSGGGAESSSGSASSGE